MRCSIVALFDTKLHTSFKTTAMADSSSLETSPSSNSRTASAVAINQEEERVESSSCPPARKNPTSIGSGLAVNDKGRLIRPTNKQSEYWRHFHSYSNDRCTANCNLCKQDVSLGESLSTSKLKQHLTSHHRSVMVDEAIVKSKESLFGAGVSEVDEPVAVKKSKITGHFGLAPAAPNYRKSYLKWVVKTYQPLNTCEGKEFREMIQSANPKVDIEHMSNKQGG